MSFDLLELYVPTPLRGAIGLIRGPGNEELRRLVFDGVLAAGGYVLAKKYARSWGLDLAQAALLTLLVSKNVAKLAVGGHLAYKGITEALVAKANGDRLAVVENVALAALAYFANTRKYEYLYNKYVYYNF